MKRVLKIMMVAMLVAFALPAMAQTVFDSGVQMPESDYQFQSTSTMNGINSQYSTSDPQINADGTAVVPGARRRPALRMDPDPSFPEIKENEGTGDEKFPIGDAVLPLMLLAVGYALYRRHHRRKLLTRVR